jgi:hypothetical protein
MTKAKTAAKTGATAKLKREFFCGGKKIKPVRLISLNRNFMAAQYENGDLVLDARGDVAAWTKIRKEV